MINIASCLYLEAFHQVCEAYVEGDDPVTSLVSMGAVLLARAYSNNPSPVELAYITGLPTDFVIAVVREADSTGLWSSDRYLDLLKTLRENPWDFKDVESALDSVGEGLVMARVKSGFAASLNMHRNGFLVGGKRQWWVDVENLPGC